MKIMLNNVTRRAGRSGEDREARRIRELLSEESSHWIASNAVVSNIFTEHGAQIYLSLSFLFVLLCPFPFSPFKAN